MITPLHIQAIAEASATRLVECLAEGTLIALCAALALRLRRQNSGTRFAIWFSALMTIAAMPFLAGILMSMSSSIEALRSTAPLHHSAITLPTSWALYLFVAWAVVASLSLSRVVISLRHIHKLRKSCSAIDPAQLNPLLRQTLNDTRVPHPEPALSEVEGRFSLGGNKTIALCTSDKVQVPTAIGFFKPAVVIPTWLLEDLSPEELNQILLHELAHLRRRDDWTNLAQQIVKALFFFHPAVWWIEKKLSLEREMACDDVVVAATAKPRAYAECLAHLAERTFIRRSLIERGIGKGIALAQAALGRMRHTSLRVAQILDPNRPSSTKHAPKQVWKPALSLIAAFAVGSVVFASREPQLVAFQDAPPRVSHFDSSIAAMDSASNTALKPIPASFVTAQAPALKKLTHPRRAARALNKVALSQVALNELRLNNETLNLVTAPAPHSESAENSTFESTLIIETSTEAPIANSSLVHLASSREASTVSTQTVFLLVEHRESGQSVYQIQMWRLTVLPSSVPAAGQQLPRKET
jgi:beta-lactamase regulating signal transducer with metallopeptidase domain